MELGNKETLLKEWSTVYNSKEAKFVLVGNVEGYKCRKEGNHCIVYNKSCKQRKLELGMIASNNKSVFLAFDSLKFNYSNISTKEILMHVNLDEEELITRENAYKITETFFDKEEEQQIEGQPHPLVINTSPVCRNHTLLLMYPDEELPQIVGSDIVLLLLNIFKVLPGVKVGYNSIGAGAEVNHLHFHLVYAEDLIGEIVLPIEKEERKLWVKSSLVNPKEEINLYSVGVKIEEIDSRMAQALVLSPIGEDNEPSEVATSLSFVFGIVANELIELCIPHNVLFTEDGNKIYIMVREFAKKECNYGWMEYVGVVPVSTEVDYEMKETMIEKHKLALRVEEKLLEALKKNIVKNLQNFI